LVYAGTFLHLTHDLEEGKLAPTTWLMGFICRHANIHMTDVEISRDADAHVDNVCARSSLMRIHLMANIS